VYDDGEIYAKGATIEGNVHVIDGYLNLQSDKNSPPARQILIDPNGIAPVGENSDKKYVLGVFKNGAPTIAVTDDGDAEFVGHIEATSGKIGGWQMVKEGNNTYLSSIEEKDGKKSGILLSPFGYEYGEGLNENNTAKENYVILAGENFGVTQDGKAYAKEFTMTGGSIGGNCQIDWD
jgi:hypothetical protein